MQVPAAPFAAFVWHYRRGSCHRQSRTIMTRCSALCKLLQHMRRVQQVHVLADACCLLESALIQQYFVKPFTLPHAPGSVTSTYMLGLLGFGYHCRHHCALTSAMRASLHMDTVEACLTLPNFQAELIYQMSTLHTACRAIQTDGQSCRGLKANTGCETLLASLLV